SDDAAEMIVLSDDDVQIVNDQPDPEPDPKPDPKPDLVCLSDDDDQSQPTTTADTGTTSQSDESPNSDPPLDKERQPLATTIVPVSEECERKSEPPKPSPLPYVSRAMAMLKASNS